MPELEGSGGTRTEGRGYRCVWTHAVSGDRFVGDLWDRDSAEYVAATLTASPWTKDVKVVPW